MAKTANSIAVNLLEIAGCHEEKNDVAVWATFRRKRHEPLDKIVLFTNKQSTNLKIKRLFMQSQLEADNETRRMRSVGNGTIRVGRGRSWESAVCGGDSFGWRMNGSNAASQQERFDRMIMDKIIRIHPSLINHSVHNYSVENIPVVRVKGGLFRNAAKHNFRKEIVPEARFKW